MVTEPTVSRINLNHVLQMKLLSPYVSATCISSLVSEQPLRSSNARRCFAGDWHRLFRESFS